MAVRRLTCAAISRASCRFPRLARWPNCYNRKFIERYRAAPEGAVPSGGSSMERPGATTMRGNPLTLIGPELKLGDAAPDFKLVDNSLKSVSLNDTGQNV